MKTKLLRKLRKRFSWVWVPPTPITLPPAEKIKIKPGYWLLFDAKLVIEFKSTNRHLTGRGCVYNIDPTESAVRLMLDRMGLRYNTKRGQRLNEREKRSLIGKWAWIAIFKGVPVFRK